MKINCPCSEGEMTCLFGGLWNLVCSVGVPDSAAVLDQLTRPSDEGITLCVTGVAITCFPCSSLSALALFFVSFLFHECGMNHNLGLFKSLLFFFFF